VSREQRTENKEQRTKKEKKRPGLPLLFVICYLLFACGSAPKTPDLSPFESGFVPLDEGASAYVLADVGKARPIIEGIGYIPLNDKNIKQMLDRTKSAAVAVFLPSSEETRRFQLVSWGSYPASGSSIAFGTNKDWKKQRSASSNPVYWHSDKAQISVAVTPSRAYVLAAITKTPHDPTSSSGGVKLPDGFGEFGGGAVFSCWLSDPGPVLNQKLKETGIPLEIPAEQLFIRLFPDDGRKYEAHVKITVPSAAQARAVVTFLAIARSFMPQVHPNDDDAAQNGAAMMSAMLSAMLFANPPVQEGSSLLIKTPSLSVDEIALLFSMFSL
jgi:hypothetical protein